MKCILMVRVSTERQSFDAQMQELHDLALKSGYKEEDITPVAEKESGIRLNEEERAGLNKMKELIETGQYDCVFAWEISRIARRKKILFSIQEYLVEHKIQLIIKEPSIRLLKSDGTIDEGAETIFTLFAQLAESEMRNKKARFKRAKEEAFALGKYQGGRVTLGYKVNSNGYWEIDEKGAEVIRLIFSLYNTGEYSMTELAKEMLSRGYFYKTFPASERNQQLSITCVKDRIWAILHNPIYIGEHSERREDGKVVVNNNIYPRIIDDETWNKCCIRRQENKCVPKSKNVYLLNQLINCRCGSSYSVNLVDGCYTCRVKHNGVEKGLDHSPNVNANLIESLAWHVALLELQSDNAAKSKDVRVENEARIAILQQKIGQSEDRIQQMMKKREKLDNDYYVNDTLSEERYNELAAGQNRIVSDEKANINRYNAEITLLNEQIENAVTFDDLFDSLKGQYENLRFGTDPTIMRSIVHRYIKNIKIEPLEGKLTSYWKIATVELYNKVERDRQIQVLEDKGMHEIATTLGTTFYLDCHHYRAYWDKELTHQVPLVLLERIKATRKDNRKGRKRNPTKNKQY